jgi:hypothetical protein
MFSCRIQKQEEGNTSTSIRRSHALHYGIRLAVLLQSYRRGVQTFKARELGTV